MGQFFNIDKEKNTSEWFTEIIKTAELADIRYGVKGFLVFQPWCVETMELMYYYLEKELKERGHEKYIYPTLIPEKNFMLESEHVEGFTPQVFWVTAGGETKFEEKLALRPTSETAFYSMFSLWIRSYKDLPFKTYQRANVFRYETKATRPFLRTREFHWIETHNAFATREEAYQNVLEDMETTKKIVFGVFGVPTIVFKRPEWDKFPGADSTFGADAIMPGGRVIQQPSTHMLGQNFSKPFNVKFVDEDEKEKYAFLTCYGPCVSRIFASVIMVHGDNKGLKMPFEISPVQVIIVPISYEKEKNVLEKAVELEKNLSEKNVRTKIDYSEKRPGEKFYYWEMKGVPLRIEIGPKELEEKKIVLYRRDTGTKTKIGEEKIVEKVLSEVKDYSEKIKEKAKKGFENVIKKATSVKEVKEIIGKGIARAEFCSVSKEGESCAEIIEKETSGKIRGTRIDLKEKPTGKCMVCGKKAEEIVYIAKEY